MYQIYSLTEAKSKFSEIINRVLFRKEKFTITKKGKAVAVVAPFDEEPGAESGEGLIRAKGALAEMDRLIDEMVEGIYQARSEETDRIAAVAMQHSFTLITGNTRHFKNIPGLRIENWIGRSNF